MSTEKKRVFETETPSDVTRLVLTEPFKAEREESRIRSHDLPRGKSWNTFSRELLLRLINSIKEV